MSVTSTSSISNYYTDNPFFLNARCCNRRNLSQQQSRAVGQPIQHPTAWIESPSGSGMAALLPDVGRVDDLAR